MLESFAAANSIDTPSVCIVLPTYNRMDVLPQCLQCLERQSFRGFEVVVVEDGATDGTTTFLENYVATTPLQMRYVRLDNGGAARARNVAVTLARAPLLMFIGDDILASTEFLATHVRFHAENPSPALAALGLTRWSETGQRVTPFMRWLDNGFQFDYNKLLQGKVPDWRHFYTSNLSVKTELLRRHRFNEGLWLLEDGELGYRLTTEEGLQIVFLPDAMAEHIHPTDFARACHRAFAIGQNSRLFDKSVAPPGPLQGVRGAMRSVFSRAGWPLRLLSAITGWLTRFWTPTNLLNRVLTFHVAAGRNSAM